MLVPLFERGRGDIFEKSRLAVSLGDRFLLSCEGALCDETLHPNTWNSSREVDMEEVSRQTGLEDLQVGEQRKGEPTYFVPRVVLGNGTKVLWFGVG